MLSHLLSCVTPSSLSPSKYSITNYPRFISLSTRCADGLPGGEDCVVFLKVLREVQWETSDKNSNSTDSNSTNNSDGDSDSNCSVPVDVVRILTRLMNALMKRSEWSQHLMAYLLDTLGSMPLSKGTCKATKLDKAIKKLERIANERNEDDVRSSLMNVTEYWYNLWKKKTPKNDKGDVKDDNRDSCESSQAASLAVPFSFDGVVKSLVESFNGEKFQKDVEECRNKFEMAVNSSRLRGAASNPNPASEKYLAEKLAREKLLKSEHDKLKSAQAARDMVAERILNDEIVRKRKVREMEGGGKDGVDKQARGGDQGDGGVGAKIKRLKNAPSKEEEGGGEEEEEAVAGGVAIVGTQSKEGASQRSSLKKSSRLNSSSGAVAGRGKVKWIENYVTDVCTFYKRECPNECSRREQEEDEAIDL